jgi:hypothetical protein
MNRFELLRALCGGSLAALLSAPSWARRDDDDDGEYRIERALYGTPTRFADVTARLRDLARRDVRFRLGNDTFGVDPAKGEVKALRIQAVDRRGRRRTFEYIEGAVVDGSLFEGWRGGAWGQGAGGAGGWGGAPGYEDGRGGDYRILRAEYGTAERHVDVTDRLRELAARDERFLLSNRTFGVDPHPGRVKQLRIHAQRGQERPRVFEFVEGGLVDGAQFSGWRGGAWGPVGDTGPTRGLLIVRAEYGAGPRRVDITQRLQARVSGNRLNVRVNNDLAGADPARNERKSLTLRYRMDGGPEVRLSVAEGERLVLP